MSVTRPERAAASLRRSAPVFAALGDETRLSLLARLGAGAPLSITSLTEGTQMSRQAVTKHLRVLQDAGLVSAVRRGRESRFEIQAKPLGDARRAIETISRQWDEALARLKAFVED